MTRPRSAVLACGLAMCVSMVPPSASASCLEPAIAATVVPLHADTLAAQWAPAHAIAAVRFLEPDRHTGRFREYLTSSGFYESPAYQLLSSNPGLMQAQIGLLGVAAAAGMDGWTAIGQLLGRDAVMAFYPGATEGSKAGVLIVAMARDAAVRQKFIDSGATAAGLMKGGKPDADKTTQVGGHTLFTAGDLKFCTAGDVLLIASSEGLIQSAINTHSAGKGSLATSGEMDAVTNAAPADAIAWATLDSKSFLAMAAEGNAPDGLIENPLGGFLFGGWVKSLLDAKGAVAWASGLTDGLSLTALVERNSPLPASHQGFAVKFPAMGVDWDSIALPRQVMSMSIARDWASLFSEREAILTLPGVSQATAFATTMTALMGNMDFMEDLLPRINGPVRLLMERQDFTKVGYTPTPKIPAFALIAPLKGGSEDVLKQRLMSSSMMALSFISLDAAQKQQPGFLTGLAEHRGVSILKGSYPPPGTPASGEMMKDSRKDTAASDDDGMQADTKKAIATGGEVNIRYNFEPVIAVVKDHYIVATSIDAMNALIDRVLDDKSGSKASETPEPDTMLIRGEQTTEILRENREELIVNRMLKEDEDRAQAERAIDAFLSLTGMVDSLTVVSTPTPTGQSATITLSMKPAATRKAGAGAAK